MARQRIKEIDILRGLAAILMILGHSFIVYPVDVTEVSWCHWVGHFIYTFHMELFFVLAGAVYYCSDYKKFIEKKFKRILLPYLFFGLLTLVLKAFGGSAINGTESLGEGIYKLLLHGGNYWFLYVLFLVFATYPWLKKILITWQSEAVFAVVVLTLRQITPVTTIFSFSTLLYYLPYFITGKIVFKLLCGGGTAALSRRNRMLGLVIGVAVYIGFEYIDIWVSELGPILSFVRAMAIITVFYTIVNELLKIKDHGWLYRFVSDCGSYSLQLYLFNGFLLTGLRIIICNMLHITEPLIIVGGIWLGNLLITLCACKYVIPKIPVLRELCGLK